MIKKIKDYFTKDDYEGKEKYENDKKEEINEYDEYQEFRNEDDDLDENLEKEDDNLMLPNSFASNKKCAVVLVSPDTFNDALKIADDLKKNKMIVLNLEDIEFEEGRKIVDFLSGTVYALGGSVNKISSKIIFLAPIFVDVNNTISLRKKEEGMDIPNFR